MRDLCDADGFAPSVQASNDFVEAWALFFCIILHARVCSHYIDVSIQLEMARAKQKQPTARPSAVAGSKRGGPSENTTSNMERNWARTTKTIIAACSIPPTMLRRLEVQQGSKRTRLCLFEDMKIARFASRSHLTTMNATMESTLMPWLLMGLRNK